MVLFERDMKIIIVQSENHTSLFYAYYEDIGMEHFGLGNNPKEALESLLIFENQYKPLTIYTK